MTKNMEYEISELSMPNEIATVVIDGLIVNRENGMTAFNVKSIENSSGLPVYIHSKCPHVTAFVPEGCEPKDSLKFVGKKDDSVKLIPYEATLTATCRYYNKK